VTSQTNVPVFFHVFDDGGNNDGGMSDSIFVLRPDQACIPSNNGPGTCRKWFGHGITADQRDVLCDVFDDGSQNIEGPMNAISNLGIQGQENLDACIPDQTSTGLCRKWFGKCQAFIKQFVPQ
jgi:hypothetical protein